MKLTTCKSVNRMCLATIFNNMSPISLDEMSSIRLMNRIDNKLIVTREQLYEISIKGLSLTSTSGPVFNLQSYIKAFIVPENGTVNTLIDSSINPTSMDDQKGTLFVEGQLIFTGSGSLNVRANYKHVICSLIMNDCSDIFT